MNEIDMFNKTYIQEQKYNEEPFGDKYFFDVNTDTSKNSSSEVADSPIDARMGATLQDKRIINMKTVGISGKFSSRGHNNFTQPFNVNSNRLGVIINYFEDALAKQKIYTVCKKGSKYNNMMLNKVSISIGEFASTIDVSLSFIEVNFVEIQDDTPTAIALSEEARNNYYTNPNSIIYGENKYGIKYIDPRAYIICMKNGDYVYLYSVVENLNSEFYWHTFRQVEDRTPEGKLVRTTVEDVYECWIPVTIKTTAVFKQPKSDSLPEEKELSQRESIGYNKNVGKSLKSNESYASKFSYYKDFSYYVNNYNTVEITTEVFFGEQSYINVEDNNEVYNVPRSNIVTVKKVIDTSTL